MATLYCLRLRRTLNSLQRSLSTFPTTPTTQKIRPLTSSSSSSLLLQQTSLFSASQSRGFRSSSVTLSQSRQYKPYQDGDTIGSDTILFEGCDYNHFLFTVDFPKDPRPTPEEMVRTYEEICAKGLNISIEEAKTKIYACSTTTYQGFQALMTEEESEKFKEIPGVVFVLPDSYIDPQNKMYGGDKYENGVITPRPPPVQYGRTNSGGRYRDRNRNPDQPRYDQPGSPMPRQGNPQYDQQGTRQGDGRNYGPPQNYPPQQNYGPPQNYPPQQNYGPPQNNPPQQNYGPPPMNNRDYASGGRDTYQADRRGPMPPYQGNYNQGQQGNYRPQERRDFPQDQRDYAPPGQREFRGDNRNYAPSNGGTYGQGTSSSYGQSYPGQGEGERLSQVEQRNMEGDQRNYAPMGQTGTNQGRY